MELMKTPEIFGTRKYKNLRDMAEETAKKHPDIPAVMLKKKINSKIISISYREAENDRKALGTALAARIKKGDYCAIVGENSCAWRLAHMTIVCGLGISVPLDRLLTVNELKSLLIRSQARVLFYGKEFQKQILDIIPELPFIDYFIQMDYVIDGIPLPNSKEYGDRFLSMSSLIAEGKILLSEDSESYTGITIEDDEPCALFYTSGTTSIAKAVLLSQKNYSAEAAGLAGVVQWKPGFRALSILPLHHTFENTCGMIMIIYYGGTICECNGLRYIRKNLIDFKINLIIGVPLIFESIYKKIKGEIQKQGKEKLFSKMQRLCRFMRRFGIDLRRKVFSSIHKSLGGGLSQGICGAAPIDAEIISFFDSIGVEILQGYGMTETCPVAAGCNHKFFRAGSVGFPISDVEIAIDNERDGTEGEILVRGGIVMPGYRLDDGSLDSSSIDSNGWFHTGDVGKLGKDGELYITGRLKSMIVLQSGEKVFPEELEYLLNQVAGVKSSLVWGEQLGKQIVVSAKFVLDPEQCREADGTPFSAQRIRSVIEKQLSEINKMLPQFKSIRYYFYSFSEMVKTTTLKIKRNIEIENIRQQLMQLHANIKDISGKNMDELLQGV